MSNCEHDKVYDNQHLLPSFPPQVRWICRKCGQEGVEVVGPPASFANEYEAIWNKFHDEEGS
ncbi:MAG: hypothetical protein PHX08_20280 [Lachnospiraceae bacterium]|nr:hypothetical protein [Lachnospiraceae bacterium]